MISKKTVFFFFFEDWLHSRKWFEKWFTKNLENNKRTRFDYKPICSQFATTHYVTVYKTIYMYYLKKSHDSLNRLYD